MRWLFPWAKARRSLSFRLTFSFFVFFTLLLVLIGLLFRNMLISLQDTQVEEALEADWVALKAYVQAEGDRIGWAVEGEDQEAAYTLARLKRMLLIADQNGRIQEISPAYSLLGPETLAEMRQVLQSSRVVWRVREDPWGVRYKIRSGILEWYGRPYYVSVGRSLALNEALVARFTWRYFLTVPVILIGGAVLGWMLTRRALRPLQNVVETSEAITSSNLSLRIPLRGAGDELDRLIETLNRMMERLERSFEQMRQFTADVSHELRTPITSVRGHLEVALLSPHGPEELRDAISTALEETERLSDVVKAMLALSQAESGQLVLRREPQDLGPIAEDILEQFRIPAEETSLQLTSEIEPGCVARIDRIQFERLLTNLLSNAVKYTPPGGQVRLGIKSEPSAVRLWVEDTGCGIPAEHLPHIFERFYRVPQSQAPGRKGLGLGLSFVAWIVKAHGGTIDVKSQPGKGTRFEVTLPKSPAPVLARG